MGLHGFFVGLAILVGTGSLAILGFIYSRKWKRAAWACLATIGSAATWYFLPALDPMANFLFFPDDTLFAPGYTAASFDAVKMGESYQDVLSRIGEPLQKAPSWDGDREYWYYSHHGPRYENYWNKIVIFSARTGRVVEKIDELYSD